MPGDRLIPNPVASFTHAIDVTAPAQRVWPWLAQMGAGRGGWYAYDRLDNGGHPSADRVVPELQQIAPGDVLPALPGHTDVFVVAAVEPPRDLVLCWPSPGGDGVCGTWEYGVEDTAPGCSRLVARGRLGPLALRVARVARATPGHRALAERIHAAVLALPLVMVLPLASFGHWVMQSRALRGIKQRAERRVPAGR